MVDDGGDLAGLCRRFRELRGTTAQKALSRKVGFSTTRISRVENGEQPSRDICEAYDKHFRTDGELVAWRQRVVSKGEQTTAEVSPTDRRDVLWFGTAVTPAVASALALAEAASHAMSAQPSVWTLTQLAEGTTVVAERYWSTPHEVLLPALTSRYEQAERIVQAARRPDVQHRANLVAGRYAYYLARLGHHSGNREMTAGFATVAEQYAEITGDALLAGSVAGLRSCVAYSNGRFPEAADYAGRALHAPDVHPYVKPRLAAYLGCALAADGQEHQARDALADMWEAGCVRLEHMPGAARWDDEADLIYSARVLADLGDSSEASRRALDALSGLPPDSYEFRAQAHLALGRATLDEDPAAAAVAGVTALTAIQAWPSSQVVVRAGRLHKHLAVHHGAVPEVIELGRVVSAARNGQESDL